MLKLINECCFFYKTPFTLCHSLAPHNLISLNFTVDLIPIKENSLTVPTMQFASAWVLNLIIVGVFVTLRTPQASYGLALSVDMTCFINSRTTQP